MKKRRIVCLLLSLIVMMAMSTTTADAASFKSKPTGVKAKCVSGVSVQVSCKAKKGATGYCFYYATKKSGKYKLGATTKTRTGTVKGLTPGKTYYFKVKAYKGLIKKTYTKMSKPVKCKAVFKAPGLSVSTQCCCKINLKMSKDPGATGFIIQRSTRKDGGWSAGKKIKTATWQDSNLNGSTTYYYRVRMYRGSYHSPWSAVKSAKTMAKLGDGNGAEYSLANNAQTSLSNADAAKLKGRNIFFLGSSITYGYSSNGDAFPDYVAKRNGLGERSIDCVEKRKKGESLNAVNGVVWKEAVSGTTMASVTGNVNTYSFRLHQNYANPKIYPDVFVCQLSLNDANKGIATGTPKKIDFDKLDNPDEVDSYLNDLYGKSFTVSGSIEFITAFAYAKWPGCQVAFYTISHFNGGASKKYAEMVDVLYKEADNNCIAILDLWNNPEITAWEKWEGNKFCLHMADSHHPKKAGYLKWTPLFESALAEWMPRAYTVTWENGDTVLEKDPIVRYKEVPSYDKETPTKAADANGEYGYEFIGWTIQGDESNTVYDAEALANMKVTEDITFVAVFEAKDAPAEPGEDSNTEQSIDHGQPAGEGGTENDSDGNNENNVLDITGMIQSLLRAA